MKDNTPHLLLEEIRIGKQSLHIKDYKTHVLLEEIWIGQAESTHQEQQNSRPVGGKIRMSKQQSPPIKDDKTHPLLEEKIGSVSKIDTSKKTKLTAC
jgi:hypothetical protein